MRIGVGIDLRPGVAEVCEQVRAYGEMGFASAWASQIFGYDALTLMGIVGAAVPDIELGTAVVPVYSRLAQVMAQQALTVQVATGGRFVLGIGTSHQVVVEGVWGIPFVHPARMMREYLEALTPMLRGERARVEGELVTARSAGPLEIPVASAPPVLLAALAPTMLRLAGSMADGTVTWMTGTTTVREHIVPSIAAAAEAAGRPSPRVVVFLPVTVTDDVERARARMDEAFAIYPTLPSYRAMLEREGATRPSDVAFVGDEEAVAAALERLADAGATDFVASILGSGEERERTTSLLAAVARR